MKVDIKSWVDKSILFTCEAASLKLAVEAAVEAKISLDYANLVGAMLDYASLDGARLVGARLDYARLDYASLDGARLDGASLDGASLVGAMLAWASLVRASLVRANLDGANLVRARLVRANLDGARLDGTSLDGARLDRARLDGASLDGARLERARLDGASLVRARLAWHVHHELLWEVLTEPIETRIAYIKAKKPKYEVATRLRLLKPIKGPLPDKITKAAMEALHKKECRGCPWDGRSIFKREERTF